MVNLVDEPGTKRLFVNDMRGPLYSVSYDGRTVALYTYLDTTNMGPTADFLPSGGDTPAHDTVLLEWTAKTPAPRPTTAARRVSCSGCVSPPDGRVFLLNKGDGTIRVILP